MKVVPIVVGTLRYSHVTIDKETGGLGNKRTCRGNLLSFIFLLRCGTRPYERGTQ